jgi:hypothetical protein
MVSVSLRGLKSSRAVGRGRLPAPHDFPEIFSRFRQFLIEGQVQTVNLLEVVIDQSGRDHLNGTPQFDSKLIIPGQTMRQLTARAL